MLDNFVPLLPEIFLTCVAFAAFIIGIISKEKCQFKNSFVIVLSGLVSTFGLYAFNLFNNGYLIAEQAFNVSGPAGVEGLFFSSGYLIIAKMLILFCATILLLVSKPYLENRQNAKFEYNIIFIMAILGAFIAVSTLNLIIMFIGLELLSFSLYILVGFNRKSVKAVKSSNKYFIVGCIASALMLYGISLVYLTSGYVSYSAIAMAVESSGFLNLGFEYSLAIILILTALFFKIGIVPLQYYLPDVLFASSRPVLGVISTISKIVGLIIIFQFLSIILPFHKSNEVYYLIMFSFALASIFVGSLFALKEDNVNKFLAYSGINNAGFMLICSTILDFNTLMFYLISYCLIILAFVCFMLSFKVKGEFIKSLKDLAYITKENHKLGLVGIVLIFSLAGVPPFILFYAKFLVIQSLVINGFIINAVLAIVFSVLAVAYCLRVIKYIYFNKDLKDEAVQTITFNIVLTYILVFIILILSINPQFVIALLP